jgi:hypothetical protein
VSAWNVQTLARWAQLGSSPRSTALDAEVEHSMDCDESQALAVRKVSRTQKLDGKEYAASKLADVLRLRKLKKL